MTEHTPPASTRPARSLLLLSFAGAFLFLYLRNFLLPATPFMAIGDEVQFFTRAVRIVHGQVPFRDFTVLVPPGADLLYAAAFRVFGVHAWVMQAWGIVTGLALCCVVTSIASRILRGPMVLLPALLFLVFDFSSGSDLTHHWYSTLATLCAVRVLMGGASVRRIVAAGVFCALASLCTQTQGAMTFVAVAVYLAWLGRSGVLARLAALAAPYIVLLTSFFGYYIHEAGFRSVFFEIVQFAPRYMSSGRDNSPLTYLQQFPQIHGLGDLMRAVPFLFVYGMVPYVYFFGMYQLWRRRDALPVELRQRLVLLHLVGLGLLLAVANSPRFFRLTTVAAPAIPIYVWLLSEPGRAGRLVRNALCLLALATAVYLPLRRQTQFHAALDLPIGRTAISDPLLFHQFQWTASRIGPPNTIFNSPPFGLYFSLRNPTVLEFLTDTEFTRPEWVESAVDVMRRDPPHYVVLKPEDENSGSSHNHMEPIRQYVHENYHLVQVFHLKVAVAYEEELWELDQRPPV